MPRSLVVKLIKLINHTKRVFMTMSITRRFEASFLKILILGLLYDLIILSFI